MHRTGPSLKLSLLRQENESLSQQERNDETFEIDYLEKENKRLKEKQTQETPDNTSNVEETIRSSGIRVIEKRGDT